MSSSKSSERRRYSRVAFDADATVIQAGKAYEAQLLDLSIKGVLVKVGADAAIDEGPVTLHIRLTSGAEMDIQMMASLAHRDERELGFRCDSIDVDSASRLRRLMELNLNCSDASERVLEELVSPVANQPLGELGSQTMTEHTDNRRRSLRVRLRTDGNLITDQNKHETELLNVSEGGALIAVLNPPKLSVGDPIELEITMPDGNLVAMKGTVAHCKGHMIGLECAPITGADGNRIKAIVAELAAQQN